MNAEMALCKGRHWCSWSREDRERSRLMEIVDNLRARIDEAQHRDWLGEVYGLGASLEAAEAKLASLDRRSRVDLGFPSMRRRD